MNSEVSNVISQDSLLLKEQLDLVNQFLDNDHIDSAETVNRKLVRLAQKNKNRFYSGKGNGISGYIHLIKNQQDSAYYYFNQSKYFFIELNDSVNIAKCLTNMAIIQSNQADFSGSESTATEALKFLKNSSNVNFISSIYNCLAISSDALDNHNEAIYWNEKAQESTPDLYSKQLYKNNIAVSYQFLSEHEKSIQILEELIKDTIQNPDLYSKILDNLTYSKFKLNANENTESQFLKALQIRIENEDLWGQNVSHSRLSEYYSKKDAEKSLFHAQKMYGIATLLNSPDDRLEALQKLISLETPEVAQKTALTYTLLSDSLVKARNLTKDRFAKIRFDSEQNREENELLRAETAEQNLEIERRKWYASLLISLLILIGVSALAFFRIQRIKNEKRINEEIQETESKISVKIHDNLANNIYRIMSDMENSPGFHLPEKKNELLNQLDTVYKLARDISRENSPVETGKKYTEELLSLISSYKSPSTNIVLIGFSDVNWMLFSKEKQIQFYKVLQELLTNMKKHSEASLVVLSFQTERNNLLFFYTDNGIGTTENQMNTKNGIRITENRIEKIKGTISFVCEPQKGLKINIKIPL